MACMGAESRRFGRRSKTLFWADDPIGAGEIDSDLVDLAYFHAMEFRLVGVGDLGSGFAICSIFDTLCQT